MAGNEQVTILLLLEAVDKASGVLGRIGQAFTNLGETLQHASEISARTAEEQQLLTDKATASAAAWTEATNLQSAAQEKLALANKAVQEAQAQAVEWAGIQKEAEAELAAATRALTEEEQFSLRVIQESSAAAAEAVKTSTATQIAALDALQATEKEVAVRSQEMAAAQDAASTESGLGAAALGGLKTVAMTTAIGVAALGVVTGKAAANFQSMTAVLATSGGEMDKTGALLESSRQGILNLAQATGTATDQLTKGMYMIGSAGFTAAKGGLDVLKAAAEGAKAENADLGVVSNALTTIMLDYGKSIGTPVAAMDQLIAVVQNGKVTTEALSASLSAVLPIANAAGLSFDQVGGALATMTAQGMSAQQSAQDLAHTIGSLQKPNNVQIQLMQQMGIDSNKLSMDLGKNGLTGTMNILLQAIAAHTKNGQVLLNTWYTSAAAASDLKTMIASMTPQMQSLAKSFLSGGMSAKDFRTALYDLPPIQRNVLMQFQTLADKANGFNSMLKAGQPNAMTFQAALSGLTGGQMGLNTMLMLSAKNGTLFEQNVAKVGAAAKGAGQDVNGWEIIQGNFNQKLAELKETVQVAAIRIGTALLPVMTKLLDAVMKIVQPMGEWISKHQTLTAVILGVIGVLGTLLTLILSAVKIFKMVKMAIEAVGTALEAIAEADPIILVITAIAVAAYLIVTHWSTVKQWLEDFWHWLVSAAKATGDFFVKIWRDVVGALKAAWGGIVDAWNSTGGKAITWIAGEWDKATGPVVKEWNKIVSDLQSIWGSLVTIWDATGGKLVSFIAGQWKSVWTDTKQTWDMISGFFRGVFQIWLGVIKAAMNTAEGFFHVAWDVISGVFKAAWDFISGIVKAGADIVMGILKAAWDVIKGDAKLVWTMITGFINTALDFIKDILKLFADLVTGKWSKLWGDIEKTAQDLWNNVSKMFRNALSELWGIISGAVSQIWDGFIKAIVDAGSGIWKALQDLGSMVLHVFVDAGKWLWNAGVDLVKGLIGGLESMGSSLVQTVTTLGGLIPKWKGPPEKDKIMLVANGQLIMQGLITGIDSQTDALRKKLEQVTTTVTASVNPTLNLGAPSTASALAKAGGNTYTNYVDLRGSQVMSDADMDKFVTKIGNRIATRSLPAAGAYIRM